MRCLAPPTDKALESLEGAGWENELAEPVLASLAAGYAEADRMKESNAWRRPVDVVAIVERAFEQLPAVPSSHAAVTVPWDSH